MRPSKAAATSAITVEKRYMPASSRPCENGRALPTGIMAAIKRPYTGRRAEQVMSGTTSIVSSRSRWRSIVRVARIAGTAQA